MARVRHHGDSGVRAPRRVLSLAAAVVLAVAPHALAVPPSPADLCLGSLAERPFLFLDAAPRFLQRDLLASPAAPSPFDLGWRRFLGGVGEASLGRRVAAAAPAAITIDAGARVGCRFGDVAPYARLDVRSLSPRDAAPGESGGAGLLRALGVLLNLDARTSLQVEASLGAPDVGGSIRDDDSRALGFALRLAVTF